MYDFTGLLGNILMLLFNDLFDIKKPRWCGAKGFLLRAIGY